VGFTEWRSGKSVVRCGCLGPSVAGGRESRCRRGFGNRCCRLGSRVSDGSYRRYRRGFGSRCNTQSNLCCCHLLHPSGTTSLSWRVLLPAVQAHWILWFGWTRYRGFFVVSSTMKTSGAIPAAFRNMAQSVALVALWRIRYIRPHSQLMPEAYPYFVR